MLYRTETVAGTAPRSQCSCSHGTAQRSALALGALLVVVRGVLFPLVGIVVRDIGLRFASAFVNAGVPAHVALDAEASAAAWVRTSEGCDMIIMSAAVARPPMAECLRRSPVCVFRWI